MLSDTAFLCLLLQALPGIGAASARSLLQLYPSVEALRGASESPRVEGLSGHAMANLESFRRVGQDSPYWQLASRQADWILSESNLRLVCWGEPDYPALLAEIPDAPAALFVRGDVANLHLPQIAIVGSRHASHGGIDTAQHFGAELAAAGFVITSGLALGIDTAAHQGALAAAGKTVAVQGVGLDRVYPARNRELAAQIEPSGTLVSEYPPGTQPVPGNFPRRNRIIAGLSLGTLVVEAASQSGSLITARLALDYGREVFAVPGSIHNPRSKGNHELIRAGAKLVETTDHLVEELGGFLQWCREPLGDEEPVAQETAHHQILDAVDYHPTDLDTIAARTGMAAADLSACLLELELDQRVEVVAGAWARRR